MGGWNEVVGWGVWVGWERAEYISQLGITIHLSYTFCYPIQNTVYSKDVFEFTNMNKSACFLYDIFIMAQVFLLLLLLCGIKLADIGMHYQIPISKLSSFDLYIQSTNSCTSAHWNKVSFCFSWKCSWVLTNSIELGQRVPNKKELLIYFPNDHFVWLGCLFRFQIEKPNTEKVWKCKCVCKRSLVQCIKWKK